MITKEEFYEWKNSSCTIALHKTIQEQAEESGALILRSTQVDNNRDQFHRGIIALASAIVGWSPEVGEEGMFHVERLLS